MIRSGRLVIIAAALAVGVLLAASQATVAAPLAPPHNTISVDADQANEPGIQSSANQPVGVLFQVSFDITHSGEAEDDWQGYNLVVDHPGLAFIPTTDLNGDTTAESWDYTGLGSTTLDTTVSIPLQDRLQGGSGNIQSTTSATGEAVIATFQCVAEGQATLHLVTSDQATTFSTTAGPGGVTLPTQLVDGTIYCGGSAPATTSTPGAGATTTPPAGTTPVPSPPQATPTPLPPGFEAVDLAAGCNPVTVTYADGTPVGSIASAVGPAGNLEALWTFEGGVWLGYSPAFPQASDLTSLDLLDVVFVCVAGPGAFARPVV